MQLLDEVVETGWGVICGVNVAVNRYLSGFLCGLILSFLLCPEAYHIFSYSCGELVWQRDAGRSFYF